MQPKRNLPWDLEQGMTLFQVRPDWYEDYWLKPDEADVPAAKRQRRRTIAACATFAVAISFMLFTAFWTRHDSQTAAMRAATSSVNPAIKTASIADARRHSGQK